MKYLLLFILSVQTGFTTAQPVTVHVVRDGTVNYKAIINNESDEPVYIPDKPFIQQSDDTLWINRNWDYSKGGQTAYLYTHLLDGPMLVESPIGTYKPDTVMKIATGPIPNQAVPRELVSLGPHQKMVISFAHRSEISLPTIAVLRFYLADTSGSDFSANGDSAKSLTTRIIAGKLIGYGK